MYKGNELVQWRGLHNGRIETGRALGYQLRFMHFDDGSWVDLLFRNLDTGKTWRLS